MNILFVLASRYKIIFFLHSAVRGKIVAKHTTTKTKEVSKKKNHTLYTIWILKRTNMVIFQIV